MTLKHCPRCRADVEDAGGFCLLGHRLPVATEDPISDLKAEVDQAFKKVQLDISSVFEEEPEAPVQTPSSSPSDVYEQLKSDDEVVGELVENRRDVWRQLSEDDPVERNDPILSFSPSPRMEWGPGKSKRRKRDRG